MVCTFTELELFTLNASTVIGTPVAKNVEVDPSLSEILVACLIFVHLRPYLDPH